MGGSQCQNTVFPFRCAVLLSSYSVLPLLHFVSEGNGKTDDEDNKTEQQNRKTEF